MVVDPQAKMLDELKPAAVVDAILAKRNLGTTRDMAPAVIAVGPGFTAPVDCDAVVETMRGHFWAASLPRARPSPIRVCRVSSPDMAKSVLSTALLPACLGLTMRSATS